LGQSKPGVSSNLSLYSDIESFKIEMCRPINFSFL
jgi:hypothetical protein